MRRGSTKVLMDCEPTNRENLDHSMFASRTSERSVPLVTRWKRRYRGLLRACTGRRAHAPPRLPVNDSCEVPISDTGIPSLVYVSW